MDQVAKLVARGAQGVIMGCTEIELLINQSHLPDLPVFESAALHIEAAARVAASTDSLDDYLPPQAK